MTKSDIRISIQKEKEKLIQSIFPSREYMCYFKTYFPEQVTTDKDKVRIKNTWKGITAHEDVLEMIKSINKKLSKRK